jgi:type I restriction enzyme M protein
VIEQFSYLLFLKRLDDRENAAERQAKRNKGTRYQPSVKKEMRWGYWTQMKAEEALSHLKNVVFPGLVKLADAKSSFGDASRMKGAQCKINKAGLLIEACNLIDRIKIAEQNQDVQGDLYEYLLGHMQFWGRGGQFRMLRHIVPLWGIIRMMVQMVDPKPRERIGDLAGGTGGFLVNAHQYILEKHTSAGILEYDAEGQAHHLIGDQLSAAERTFMSSKKYLRGFDNDSGMTILWIGSMNLMLYGIESPQFYYMDSLSKSFDDERDVMRDVILMNPPFKGAVDAKRGGRAAVIVPDGVLPKGGRAARMWRCVAGLSRRIGWTGWYRESIRAGADGESTRQVEGLFESLLAQSFDGGR